MERKILSSELLCLIFIVTVSVLFGKVLINIRDSFGTEINNLQDNNKVVNYQAYSHRCNERIEYLKDLNIIRNKEDLDYFKEIIKKIDLNVSWLDSKLDSYDEDFFKDKTLVILSIVNTNNITSTRINEIYEKDKEIIISIDKHVKDYVSKDKYTWFAVIEIEDTNSEIDLNIIKE